jgi:hypothetical protein
VAKVERANLKGQIPGDPPLAVLQLIRQLQQLTPHEDEVIAVPAELFQAVVDWFTWNFNNSGDPKWIVIQNEEHADAGYRNLMLCGHFITPDSLACIAS